MFDSFILYFKTFIHPWDEREPEHKITYVEVLGVSWALHIIYTFYSVFAVYLGVKSYEYFSNSDDFSHLLLNSVSFSVQKMSLFIHLSEAAIYPLVFYFAYKLWIFLLSFFTNIFESPEDAKERSVDIVHAMFTANIFLVLPIVGAMLSFLAQIFLLFRGLVRKLKFTKTQAVLVLMTPFFLITLLLMLIVSYFVFLLSLI